MLQSIRRQAVGHCKQNVELIEWMSQDYGFDKLDAYALLGQVSENTVANIVDPAYTVIAKVKKRYLR